MSGARGTMRSQPGARCGGRTPGSDWTRRAPRLLLADMDPRNNRLVCLRRRPHHVSRAAVSVQSPPLRTRWPTYRTQLDGELLLLLMMLRMLMLLLRMLPLSRLLPHLTPSLLLSLSIAVNKLQEILYTRGDAW